MYILKNINERNCEIVKKKKENKQLEKLLTKKTTLLEKLKMWYKENNFYNAKIWAVYKKFQNFIKIQTNKKNE